VEIETVRATLQEYSVHKGLLSNGRCGTAGGGAQNTVPTASYSKNWKFWGNSNRTNIEIFYILFSQNIENTICWKLSGHR
jgi:hypothetical protein